jgi:inosine/xanthosine triphosphatase
MQIFVGSTNPVKVKAAKQAAISTWPDVEVRGLVVASGIPEQPIGDDQTRLGALQRAQAALAEGQALIAKSKKKIGHQEEAGNSALYSVLGLGLEGGVLEIEGELWSTVWGVVVDQEGEVAVANGARFPIPEIIAQPIRLGEEMGPVVESLMGESDIRKKQGMIGVLTNNFVTRTQEYASIAKIALGLWYGRNWQKPDLQSDQPSSKT